MDAAMVWSDAPTGADCCIGTNHAGHWIAQATHPMAKHYAICPLLKIPIEQKAQARGDQEVSGSSVLVGDAPTATP